MTIISLKLEDHFSTLIHNPSPHRLSAEETPVSERKLPIVYECSKCKQKINIKASSFEKHSKSDFSNLSESENTKFSSYLKENELTKLSFLDFYCPKCTLPTKILFEGGPSGYWGAFYLKIKVALILK